LKTADIVYTVKVEDLHPTITKEVLQQIFSAYGEIANIYLPVDLKHGCQPKGIAFIRYLHQSAAERAISELNGINLGIGRDIICSLSMPRNYFNQDESFYNAKKWMSIHDKVRKSSTRHTNNSEQQKYQGGGPFENYNSYDEY
jgi:RNA recognition motif-containing protein